MGQLVTGGVDFFLCHTAGSCLSCSGLGMARRDRKSTRLNSSHGYISYAVFCLKKKKTQAWPGRLQWRSPEATTLRANIILAGARVATQALQTYRALYGFPRRRLDGTSRRTPP